MTEKLIEETGDKAMRIWSPGRKMKHNPLSSPSYGKRTQPNIVNNKIDKKEMNKLLNHSPKRE